MKLFAQIFGLILLGGALVVSSACDFSAAQSNKKGPNEDVAVVANSNSEEPEKQKTYELSPEFIEAEMQTLDGKVVKLSDYKGKVVLINQWATWCGPCRMEIPELIKLSREMEKRGVVVIGMTIEDTRGNSPYAVQFFVKEQEIPYQIVWATPQVWDEFGEMTGYSIPGSFILNREGKLTAAFRGFNPRQTPLNVRNALEKTLAN